MNYNISAISISKYRIQKGLKHGSKVVGNCRGTIPSWEVSVLDGGGGARDRPLPQNKDKQLLLLHVCIIMSGHQLG